MSGAAYCVNHPGVEATGACDDCKQAICTKCTKGTLDGFMCPPCAHRRYGRRKLVTVLKVVAVGGAFVGIAVVGLLAIGRGGEPSGKPPIDASMDALVVDSLRHDRDAAPCDRAVVRKLVTKENDLGLHADAVDDANAHLAKCDDFPRLRWDLLYALQQLGRYPEAIKQSTLLITNDAYDSDFWWWRGEDRGRSHQEVLALADYRQSFANSQNASGSRFAASRILDVVEAAGRPCEGVFALRFFVDVHGGEIADALQAKSDVLARTAGCDAKHGTGDVSLPAVARGPARIDVVIGGAKGRFQLDERCGTTAITAAFAAKAGVAAAGPTIDTLAVGAIRSGPLASADLAIGGARATAIDVAIVDALPDGLDGVLGLSLLWRFDLETGDYGALTLVGQ